MMDRRQASLQSHYGAFYCPAIDPSPETKSILARRTDPHSLSPNPRRQLIRGCLLALIFSLIPASLFAAINPLTGTFETEAVDLIVQFQSIQLEVSRSWTSKKTGEDPPSSWSFRPFRKRIVQERTPEELIIEDGAQRIVFERKSTENRFVSLKQGYVLVQDNEYHRTKQDGNLEVYKEDGRLSAIHYPDGKILRISSEGIRLQMKGMEDTLIFQVSYNPQGRITGIRAYNGVSSSYSYNADGLLQSATNQNHLTTDYGYDRQGRLNQVAYQTGDFVKVLYDETTGLVNALEKKDGVTKYEYVRGETGLITKAVIEGPRGIQQQEILSSQSGGIRVRSTNSQGHVTEEAYTSSGLLASYTDAANHTVTYSYDDLNRLDRVNYPDDSSVTYSYLGQSSLIIRTVLPNGAVIEKTYNDHKQLVKVSGPGTQETSYSYNAMGLPQKIVQGKDKKRATTLTYDERGFLTAERDALGRTTKYQRDLQGRLTGITDPLGRNQEFQYNQYGQIKNVLQASQPVLSRTYNQQLQMTKETNSRGLTTHFAYSPQGAIQAITYPKGIKEGFEYDQHGDLAAKIDADGNRITLNRDDNDEAGSTKDKKADAPTKQYDPLGNLIKEVASDGSSTQWQYDPMNRLQRILFPGGETHEYGYDRSGNLISEKDIRGNHKHYAYDQAGNLTNVRLPSGEQITYDLDPQGTGSVLAAHTSDGRTYQYQYDIGRRLVQTTLPWGEQIRYTYDVIDRLTQKSSSTGSSVSYQYDAFDRMTHSKSSDGDKQEFIYGARGNLITIKGPQSEKHLTYNEFGELISEKYPLIKKTIHYAYDQQGNRTSLEIPGHLIVRYQYDSQGNLTHIGYGQKQPDQIIRLSYNFQNRKKTVEYPNGVSIGYHYTPSNLLDQITFFNPEGQAIRRQEYEYDGLKRITKITDSQGPSKQFRYDANGQLIQAMHGDQTNTYQYGSSFQRLKDTQGENIEQFQYNKAGQLIKKSALAMKYDRSGNLTKLTDRDQEKHFIFNAVGMLETITTPTETVQYTYSPEGQRILKQVGDSKTSYLYDGKNLLMVLDQNNNPIQTFIQGNVIDSPLVMLEKKETYYFLSDQQGSTLGLANTHGNVTTRYEYDPFGRMTRKGKETSNPLTYTGRFYDQESGLYYYRARYYASQLGVFLSPDPYPKSFEFPETFNDYAYVQNDPINLVDPLGLIGAETGRHLMNTFLPAFTEPTMLGGPGANPAAFWQRMAADYQWLHQNVGTKTAERFRQMMNRGLYDMLPKRQPPKPGMLSRIWEAGKGLAGRIGAGAGNAGRALGNVFRSPPSPTIPVNLAPRAGNPTGMVGGPRPTGQLMPAATNVGPPSGMTALTEGKSSFQNPSLAARLNQPVSGVDIGGGILGAALIGYDVGSQYAEQARREGRSVTASEYAQSAGLSAARAVGSVLTLGGSEVAIAANRARQEGAAALAAQEERDKAEEAARVVQRQAADRIQAFATQATDLVSQATAFQSDQTQAIQQAKSQYESAQGKLAQLEGFQTPADFNAECRTCQSKIDQLVKLKGDAEGYKDPLIKNRDLAKERRVLVCQNPHQPDASSHVQMASGAASLAQGNVQAIQRFASKAPALQSDITQCLASIEANKTALMDLQSTIGRVDSIVAEISSLADQARAFGAQVRSFREKCQHLRGRLSRIDNIAKGTPDQIVIQIGGEDGPHEIVSTAGSKATIATAVGNAKNICDKISSDATKGDTYGTYADALAKSGREKASSYKAKLEAQTVHACTAGPLPSGIAADLQALVGAAEVLASYATTDAGQAQQCVAKAQQTPQTNSPPSEENPPEGDLLAGFPEDPDDSSPSGSSPPTAAQRQAAEEFGGNRPTSDSPQSDPNHMVSDESNDPTPFDVGEAARAERDQEREKDKKREHARRERDAEDKQRRQEANRQDEQDVQSQEQAARARTQRAREQGQSRVAEASNAPDPTMSASEMAQRAQAIDDKTDAETARIDEEITTILTPRAPTTQPGIPPTGSSGHSPGGGTQRGTAGQQPGRGSTPTPPTTTPTGSSAQNARCQTFVKQAEQLRQKILKWTRAYQSAKPDERPRLAAEHKRLAQESINIFEQANATGCAPALPRQARDALEGARQQLGSPQRSRTPPSLFGLPTN